MKNIVISKKVCISSFKHSFQIDPSNNRIAADQLDNLCEPKSDNPFPLAI
ncbi:hypothetical protein J2T15_001867 [Paenibacillus harenae]|uniref:Uncharacterized protein n=1 Tax=Paenibacillus harenae TaxID=306543 RepID=A0ABT9TYJ9_PAEHA|nr:hypothetical protein [Paenibacillus harenae]